MKPLTLSVGGFSFAIFTHHVRGVHMTLTVRHKRRLASSRHSRALVTSEMWQDTHEITGDSSSSVRVIGPFRVAWDTPGFVNPSDNGPVVLNLPAGSIARVFAVVREEFDQSGEIDLYGGASSATADCFLYSTSDITSIHVSTMYREGKPTVAASGFADAAYAFQTSPGAQGDVFALVNALYSYAQTINANLSPFVVADEDSVVCAAYYPHVDPFPGLTSGTVDIYVLVQYPS